MATSRAQLCPRGYGRTSYHISETVQMGLVPIHVYADEPWVPYPDTVFPQLGFATSLKGLYGLLARLAVPGAVADLSSKEAAALKYAASHFSLPGVMEQVALFMRHPRGTQSDLRCAKLPKDPRAETFPEETWTASLKGANDKSVDVQRASFLDSR